MKRRLVHDKWWVWMTDHQADWDVWENWEKERIDSIAERLKRGDILYDVGAEHGSMSGILAQIVGPENMVLIEPSPVFWPEIYLTWKKNDFHPPRACWAGFLGDHNETPEGVNFDPNIEKGWPVCAGQGGEAEDVWAYRYIRDHSLTTPTITLDSLVEKTGATPAAISMDIEGGELHALRGAERTLTEARPLVWVSIHPDLLMEHFRIEEVEVHAYMTEMGYDGECLAVDHEEHWLFEPRL